jgi:hypothetical protein
MKTLLKIIIVLFLSFTVHAQVGIGTTTPNGALDITSTTDGLLIPRVALTDLTTLTVLTPTASELVYNTTSNGTVEPGYYYLFDNGVTLEWVRFGGSGWLLDGNTGVTALNFIGSINDADVAFKRFNTDAGKLTVNNTSFGVGALANVIQTLAGPGRDNVAFGKNALGATVNGVENVAIGSNALSGSTAFGANSSVGYANIAVGYNTLMSVAPGNDVVALGYQAGMNNTGSQFIAIGKNAGTNNAGLENIAIGEGTLSNYTDSASRMNVAIGSNAMSGTSSATVSKNVAIGNQAAQGIVSSLNVAIGNTAMLSTSGGEQNVAVGAGSMEQGNNSFNTAVGEEALFSASGNNNVAIGHSAARTGAGGNNIVIGSGAPVSGDNNIVIGSGPVGGQTAIVNAASWGSFSDRRLKSNIIDSPLGLDFIKTIRPVSYFRNNDKEQKTEFGFIAQELDEALKTAGITNNGIIIKTATGMFAVRYNDFLPMTVKAVQEQQALIEALQKQNEELLKANAAILKRLEALENK